ncbi:MAG: hypothetical protein K0R39_3175 [Symbiobacteriaceae bacterium]|jgi:hypothetical protein|nr:hypothetical protein [Symbiobacteriaceae bacterium]
MRRERILVLAVSLLTAVAVAGTAAASKPTAPTDSKPTLPKPDRGAPTTPAPAEGNPHGAPPAANPKGTAPAEGVPSTPKPEAIPGANKPERIQPSARPGYGTPSLPEPTEAQPTPEPKGGIPNGNPPSGSKPKSAPPKPAVAVKGGLKTLTQPELESLVGQGYGLADIRKADEAAAKGIGTVPQILGWLAEGKSWSAIMQVKSKTPPTAGLYAADVRALLAEAANTGIRSLLNDVAAQTGLTTEGLLDLMGDQYTLSDIRNAAGIAAASDQELQTVLTLKTAEKTWQEIANQLKP